MTRSGERLALGTAQFGLSYGIANRTGQLTAPQAAEIVAHATAAGIDTIDTAIGYGDAERMLGTIGVGDRRVVTKLPALPDHCVDVNGWVHARAGESRDRIGVPRLYAVLLHRPSDLLTPRGDALYRALVALKSNGIADAVGVSIYGPQELDALCSHFDFDVVQSPLNVLDRRLVESEWLARLSARGVRVHARSAFLQGVLLMSRRERSARFGAWAEVWRRWDAWLVEHALTPQRACLGFALSHDAVERVVVGVDSVAQLDDLITAAAQPLPVGPPDVSCTDLHLIDPTWWEPA